ncbi:sulfite exporter TauE/SafE family protein [Paenibacillus antri]|uniref:sulfite exporter TauE/SafE family protein n=1 Tax=Paenibacillus antri TaxID=2582848 RepID=UPI00192E3362|nr:sulfite exporter TauE/SafE family protein [Paenibacillus antri]
MIITILLLLSIGILASTFGSIVGLGGGIIIIPALLYLDPVLLHRGISTASAVGTSMVVLVFTALSSTLAFHKQKKVDVRSGLLFFASSGPAALLGASFTGLIAPGPFQIGFGCFILFVSALLLLKSRLKPLPISWKYRRSYTDAAGITHHYGYNLSLALPVGFSVGFVSGLFGIGGGSLFVPLMILLFAFPAHLATATSMFVIFLSSITGSLGHTLYGEIDWFSALFLAPGAWIGGRWGAAIANRLSGNALLWVMRVAMVLLGLRMIWSGVLLVEV